METCSLFIEGSPKKLLLCDLSECITAGDDPGMAKHLVRQSSSNRYERYDQNFFRERKGRTYIPPTAGQVEWT